jgi:hypothetical protein
MVTTEVDKSSRGWHANPETINKAIKNHLLEHRIMEPL